MTLSRSFVEWGLSLTEVPEEVRHAARRHVLDAIGNAIAARRQQAIDYVVSEVLTYTAPTEASVFGGEQRVPAPLAALANGALIHALDFDDTHSGALIHGTAVTLPAALAMAQTGDRSLRDAIDAFVVGLEVTLRIGRAVPHGFHARGFHATPVAGIFGATLAAARLARLDETKAVNALGIAGSQTSGSLEFLQTGSSTKQIHPGWAGLSALFAVRLADRGATGPESILEGPYGLFRSYLDTDIDVSSTLADLEEIWETTRMTMKPYPVCQLSHASLDAASDLSGKVAPASIREIEIRLPRESIPVIAEPRANKIRPRSTYEAKFSVQWDVAALLIDGAMGLDLFEPSALERSDITDLASRVHVNSVNFDGVPADAPGHVILTTTDGQIHRAEVPASRGSAAMPINDGALIDKFEVNVGATINEPRTTAGRILRGDLPSVDDLFALTEMG